MANILKIFLTCILAALIYSGSEAQVKSVYENMSLNEILDVDVVVTASKKPEDLFEAPLSTTIIKKEDIANSGVTSIPEALRLAPGLIVREITPGNFDVEIRGFGDITKNAYVPLPFNTTTLVMIDNRIVYSYFSGGTFWETFPIDLNDIERIEVVRGPASALYGPNAVSGVINIITSQASKKGLNAFVDGSVGNNRASKASTNIGYNWNDKTKLSVSGNFTEFHRFDTDYFNYETKEYTSIGNQDLLIRAEKDVNTHETWTYKEFQEQLGSYYDEDVSLRKMGGNVFLSHSFTERTFLDVSLGGQKSQSQKTGFYNYVTPLSQINSKSFYLNSRIKINDFSSQINVTSGQDLSNYKFNSYKFTNVDASLEYYKQFNKISFRPGISFKHSEYNSAITYDEPFSLTTLNYQYKDQPRTIASVAASLLTEWTPISKLRIIGAGRLDKFDINKNISVNYELASTYRINKNNLIRFVYSKATRSPFIFDTYLNANFKLNLEYQSEYNTLPVIVPINLNIRANKNLKYPEIRSHELGWRTKLQSNLSLDLELFYSHAQNFVVSDAYRTVMVKEHFNNLNEIDSVFSVSTTTNLIYENFDVEAQQYGSSISIVYNPNEKLNAKIFGTYQFTKMKGKTDIDYEITSLQVGELNEENVRSVEIHSFTNPTQWSDKLTPSFYGGFYLNYKPGANWNLATDAYVYTQQCFVNYDFNNIMSDYTGIYNNYDMDIQANMVLNAKVSYRLYKNVILYGTIKNILGTHREYGYADNIGTLYLIGLKWEL